MQKPIQQPLLLKKKPLLRKPLSCRPSKRNLLLLKLSMQKNSQSKSNKQEKQLLRLKK
jgi:hypothetical protein